MKFSSRILMSSIVPALGLLLSGHAIGTTTRADASAFVSGGTQSQTNTGGPGGAQASASQVIPSPAGNVFVSAQASSFPGTLRAVGVARTDGTAGGFQGQGFALWADGFTISAFGYHGPVTGTFSGSVQVNGGLLALFGGRSIADTQIFADLGLDPHTGFNSGIVRVHGEARDLNGYQIGETRTGSENFTLSYANVPFTFDQNIDISLQLLVSATVNGDIGRSEADYSHTMTWTGISEVRDALGNRLTDFSALSPASGFNFAAPTAPTAVPEPGTCYLLLTGLFALGKLRRADKSASKPTDALAA